LAITQQSFVPQLNFFEKLAQPTLPKNSIYIDFDVINPANGENGQGELMRSIYRGCPGA